MSGGGGGGGDAADAEVAADAEAGADAAARLAREQRALRIIADVSAVLACSAPQLDAVLDIASRSMADAVGDSCIISLVDKEAGLLRPAAFHHRDPEGERVMASVLTERPLRLGEGIPGQVAETGERVVVSDLPEDEVRSFTNPEFHEYLDRHPLSAFVVEPLVASGEVLGTALLSRGTEFSAEDQALAADLAGRVALAVDRARLFEREQTALHQLELSHRQLTAVTDNVHAMVGYWDRDLRNGFANRRYTQYFGLTPEEIRGRHISEVLGADLAARNMPFIQRALAGEELTFDVPMVDIAGRARRMQATYTPNVVAGKVQGFYVLVSDVTEQVVARQALEASEERFRTLAERYRMLAENASDVVFRIDPSLLLAWISPSVREVLGERAEDVIGKPVTQFWHPDDRERILAELQSRPGEPASYEARFRMADGTWRWFAVTSRPARDDSGALIGRIGSIRDIQSQVEDRQALARSEQRFRLALEHAPSGMAVVDLDRRFVEVNPALCRMLGRDQEWLLAHRVPDILEPDDDQIDLQQRAELLGGSRESVVHEARLTTADGRTLWVNQQVGLLRDADGAPLSFVSQYVDITEARRHREELQFVASHDQLTGLLNRTELLGAMERELLHGPRRGDVSAVLFLDVDSLKPVNDSLGHAVGDELLTEVARRLTGAVRSHDVVARLGGDEFVVFLTGLRTMADATGIADKILAVIAAPMELAAGAIHTSVSIGIAVAPTYQRPEECLALADAALYRAKARGGGSWALAEAPQP